MYPLDFEEFLIAKGYGSDLIEVLHNFFITRSPVPESIHHTMMKNFNEYITVGGLHEVVALHFNNPYNYKEVHLSQQKLFASYKDFIAYNAPISLKDKPRLCYNSIPTQLLTKENQKFQYKMLEPNGKKRKYISSINYLSNTKLINLSYNLHYKENKEDNFRAYLSDLSLLMGTQDFLLKQHIIENTMTPLIEKALYKCAIADILAKKGYPLFFYRNETTKKEVDFLLKKEEQFIPIKIQTRKERSLLPHTNTPSYILSTHNIEVSNNTITLPLYMAMFL